MLISAVHDLKQSANDWWNHQREEQVDRDFGQWIKALRLTQGINIWLAAGKLCMSPQRLTLLEKGSARMGVTGKECETFARVYGRRISEVRTKAGGIVQ